MTDGWKLLSWLPGALMCCCPLAQPWHSARMALLFHKINLWQQNILNTDWIAEKWEKQPRVRSSAIINWPHWAMVARCILTLFLWELPTGQVQMRKAAFSHCWLQMKNQTKTNQQNVLPNFRLEAWEVRLVRAAPRCKIAVWGGRWLWLHLTSLTSPL